MSEQWYWCIEDAIPQQFDEEPLNYRGGFDTWRDAVVDIHEYYGWLCAQLVTGGIVIEPEPPPPSQARAC